MKARLVKHLLIFSLAFVCALMMWEVTLRSFFPKNILPNLKTPAFGIPTTLSPRLQVDMIKHRHYPVYKIITNENRVRNDRAIPHAKSPDTFRILILGDSIVFGAGVNNGEMVSRYLEDLHKRNADGKQLEVINASVGGWGLLEYYIYFKNEGYKYSPDLVILSQVADDIRQDFSHHTTFKNIYLEENTVHLEEMRVNYRPKSWVESLMGEISKIPFYNHLTKFSQLLFFARINLNKIRQNSNKRFWNTDLHLDEFLKSMAIPELKMATWEMESFKFKLPDFKSNPIQFFGKLAGKSREKIYANTIIYFFLFNQLMELIEKSGSDCLVLKIPAYKLILKMTENLPFADFVNNRNHLSTLDLSPPFTQFVSSSKIPVFYPRDNHWTPAGHRLAAQIIANYLSKEYSSLAPYLSTVQDLLAPELKTRLENANSRIAGELNNDPFWKFVEGVRHKNANRLVESEKTFKKYLELKPTDSEAHFMLGRVYWQMRDFQNALIHFNTARTGHLLERPKYEYFYKHTLLFGKAWKLVQEKNDEEAIAALARAEELKGPLLAEVYHLMGTAYSRSGRLEKAEQVLEKMIDLKPGFPFYRRNLGNFHFEHKQYKKAMTVYQDYLALNPKDLKIYIMLALSQKMLGNQEKSFRWFQEFLRKGGTREMLREWKLIPQPGQG